MRLSLVLLLFLLLSVFLSAGLQASESEALALLKGVEQKISKDDSFHLEYVITYEKDDLMSPGKVYTHSFFTDYHQGDIFTYSVSHINDRKEMVLSIKDGVYVYTVGQDSVRLLEIKKSESYPAYDPRVLFLSDLAYTGLKLSDCLLYGSRDSFSTKQSELNGKPVWIVCCNDRIGNEEAFWELWIEESSFRIHKKVFSSKILETLVENTYDAKNLGPFPSEIVIQRKFKGKTEINRKISVTAYKKIDKFSSGLFSLASFNLPTNATVHDSRAMKRIGFWDGEKLVERPVSISAQEQRELEAKKNRQPLGNTVRYILMGTGIVMIIFALISMYRNRRKKQ